MHNLTKAQFLVLLALADGPLTHAGLIAAVRGLTGYRLKMRPSTAQSVLKKLAFAELIKIDILPSYLWTNLRRGKTYEVTGRGLYELEKELVFYRALLRKAPRSMLY